MKKLLLTFAVLLGFALPGLAETVLFYAPTFDKSSVTADETVCVGTDGSTSTGTALANGEKIGEFIKLTLSKGGNSNNGVGIFSKGKDFRMYPDNTAVFTPAEGVKITEIEFVATGNSYVIKGNYKLASSTESKSIPSASATSVICKFEGGINEAITFTPNNTSRSKYILVTYTKESTGPVDFEPAFKNQAYTIYKDENLDINSLITVNTPPSVTYALPEGTTAIEQTANGVFVGKEATAAPVTVTASWEAVADKWNAGSATFSISVMLQPVEFGSPYTDMETPCQTKNLETSETPVTAADFWGNMGSVEVMYSYAEGNLALNMASTDKITMTRENNDGTTDVVGEISATDETKIMVMNPEDEEDGMFYMHFASLTPEDEMDPTPVLPDGLYTMTIPAGFMLIDGAPNLEYKAQWRVGKEPVLVTETITRSNFTSTKTGYNDASYTSKKTGITYDGFMYLDEKDKIQLRASASNNKSGIAVTGNPNGYTLYKVDFKWATNTTTDRKLNMYVSDEAYTAPSDLHKSGLTVYSSQTYTGDVDASFGLANRKQYVGFRSDKDPLFLESITLYWIAPPAPTAPEFTLDPTEEGAEYTDISNYGHKVTITREEGVTYTYRLNEEEIEKELAENLILTPGAESGIGFGTINTMVIVAKKGGQTVESEKAYFLTHPYASVSEGKIKLTSVAPAEHNVKIYYTIIDSAEPQAIRATRAAGTEYAAPVTLTTGQKIQYWAEAAHPVNAGETLKSAVVTNSLKDDGTLVGVDSIEADENAPVEFYTIDGLRVAEPENGLYIVRQGNKVYKVVIRK